MATLDALHETAATVADVSELTADELIRQGERLLKLGRDLLGQAARLQTLADIPSEERSVGSNGIITETTVIQAARELGHFTVQELGYKLGIKTRSATMRWIARLVKGTNPACQRLPDGSYRYIHPGEQQVKSRPRKKPLVEEGAIAERNQPVAGTGRADLRSVPRHCREIVREAQSEGWVLKSGGKHLQLIKDGRSVTFAKTPTNPHDAADHLRRDLFSGREHLQRAV